MILSRRASVLGTLLCLLAACGGKDASSLTHPPRKASFPLYVTVPGTSAGMGALFKVNAPSEQDASSVLEPLLKGLDFPAAVAVDRSGTVYYTDRATSTTGRVMRYLGEDKPPEEIATGLSDPQGLAIDLAGRLYVSESGANRISLVHADGTLVPVSSDLVGPRSLSTDENDNLYVAEPLVGTVSKVIPDGTKQSIASGVVNPLFAGPGLVGNLFYLVGNAGLADGMAVKVDSSGASSTYLDKLINPQSLAWEDGTVLYVAEGVPALKVVKFSRVSNIRTITTTLPGDPHSMAFTPFD